MAVALYSGSDEAAIMSYVPIVDTHQLTWRGIQVEVLFARLSTLAEVLVETESLGHLDGDI